MKSGKAASGVANAPPVVMVQGATVQPLGPAGWQNTTAANRGRRLPNAYCGQCRQGAIPSGQNQTGGKADPAIFQSLDGGVASVVVLVAQYDVGNVTLQVFDNFRQGVGCSGCQCGAGSVVAQAGTESAALAQRVQAFLCMAL
jgi:hypothetical protein